MISRKAIATAARFAAALAVAALGLWFAVSPWTVAGSEAAADASLALYRETGHAPREEWVMRWSVLIGACLIAAWAVRSVTLWALGDAEGG